MDVPGQTVSCHVAQVPGAEGSDELQTHVGRDVLGILDCPGSGEVSLEGTGIALYAVQPGVYVRMTRPLLLDKGLELDRELKQFLAQDACSDSLPPGWVGVEGSEKSSRELMVVTVRIIPCSPLTGLLCPSLPLVWPRPSAWRRCACVTAGVSRCSVGSGSGLQWWGCCKSCRGQVPWPAGVFPADGAVGTPCVLGFCFSAGGTRVFPRPCLPAWPGCSPLMGSLSLPEVRAWASPVQEKSSCWTCCVSVPLSVVLLVCSAGGLRRWR